VDRFRGEAHLEGEEAEQAEKTVQAIGEALYWRFSAGRFDRVLEALPGDLHALLG
jgi:hypothetical protein